MTLEDGTELSPALGIGAFAEKTLVHAGQCTKVDPAVKPEVAGPARLRRDGRHRRRPQHRQRQPRRHRRRDRLRRRRRRGDRRRPAGRRPADHRGRRRRPEAGVGEGLRRHAHGQRADRGRRRRDPGAHRRVRRGRRHRRRRPPGDLAAGVLRARPGRHRRPRRRPGPAMRLEMPLIDVFGAAARSSRPGTATACPPATSRRSSSCTWPAGCRWSGSSARPSASTTSRRRSGRCTTATSCARWSCCE